MSDSDDARHEIHSIGPDTREWLVDGVACPSLSDFGITLAGISRARVGFRFQRLRAAFTQVLACYGGRGRIWLPNDWHTSAPGTAYLTSSGSFHRYHAVSGSTWRLVWVMYGSSRQAPQLSAADPLFVQVDPRPLRDAVWGLYQEAFGRKEPAMLRRWVELVDAQARRLLSPFSFEPRLWKLWQAVDADIARDWGLSELAKVAGASEERLRVMCQAQLGTSPMRYLAELRMRRAALLLRSTPETIESIALSVGYSSAFSFSTAFHKVMKVTPSQYRKTAAQ